jgi:hypothetical protein
VITPVTAETNRRFAERKTPVKVLAIGGETGAGEYVAMSFGQVATSVVAEIVPACGRWIADERPEWLSRRRVGLFRAQSDG